MELPSALSSAQPNHPAVHASGSLFPHKTRTAVPNNNPDLSSSVAPPAFDNTRHPTYTNTSPSSMSPVANTAAAMSAPASSNGGSVSPRLAATPKNVAFELVFTQSPECRARLPMRVQIYPHDTTESIVTTVKNFYGLYSGVTGGRGVSFEDAQGNTLIARYENFRNNMVVYVRVIEGSPGASAAFAPPHSYHPAPMGSEAYFGGDVHPAHTAPRLGQDMSRSASRSPRKRSPSPNAARDRRSESVGTASRMGRSRSIKAGGSSLPPGHTDAYNDSTNGYSSGDGAPDSASGKNKEQLGNTDISVENIVEGGRRKRAKFESSELPLFAPPQMPAATSNPSVSPARRIDHQRPSLPFVHPGQNPFTQPRPMQSPQHYRHGVAHSTMYATPASDSRRSRGSIGYPSNGANATTGSNILPTPDPTVGSCMSEEDKDVAIQLMRLGEMSNISHGRTSASTLDDTFSGRADAASSTGATSEGDSESEAEMPPARRQKMETPSAGTQIYQTTESHFMPPPESREVSEENVDYGNGHIGSTFGNGAANYVKSKLAMKPKQLSSMPKPPSSKSSKSARPSNGTKAKKAVPLSGGPMSPASASHSRKQSNASVSTMGPPGEDDHPDLSTKPRCQRCRKSKKGCDRQRPCGRCKDAGLSADQCISEDEGNGRKGRYGRHMGVPLSHEEAITAAQPSLLPAAPITTALMTADKSKKRKR